jgi:hypothetical protein
VTRVPVDSRTERATAVVVLTGPSRVIGRILGHDGKPVPVTMVRVYCETVVRYSELDLREIRSRAPYNAITVAADTFKDEARLCVMNGCTPDEKGNFDLDVNHTGEGLLVIWVPGHRPVRRSLGWLAGEREVSEIRLARPERIGRIQFRYRGIPLENHTFIAADISSEVGQLQVPLSRLDEAGELAGDWFESGRRYFFDFYGPELPDNGRSGCLDFRGQNVVEISTDLKKMK